MSVPYYMIKGCSDMELRALAVVYGLPSIESSGVVAVPTDTIYGLACLAEDAKAVKKLYSIKGRDETKPVSICVSKIADIYRYANVTCSMDMLSELLPGPVTVVFNRIDSLDINPESELIGIRIPDNGFICHLVEVCGGVLALTSANRSGDTSNIRVLDFREIWDELDGVFDGGELGGKEKNRRGSSIIDLSCEGYFRVLREGMDYDRTREILGKYSLLDVDVFYDGINR